MGACASSNSTIDAMCTRKKYSKPTKSNMHTVISRPTAHDLSSSMDAYVVAQKEGPRVNDLKSAQVGVHFIRQELIIKLPKNYQRTQTKVDRLQKWKEMITYGLESKFSQKVFKSSKTQLEPDDITSYAFVGLSNFYSHHPDKFESRLSKGPPPCYRWLAWRFISKQVLTKQKGEYESML